MVEKLLKGAGISYKLIDEDTDFKLIKINSKMHLFYLHDKGNKFLMARDFFDYLDGNSLPYSILCRDDSSGKLFYLKLNKNINWIKSCFESCDKDAIFLGKQVLNAQITESDLCCELKKLTK